MVNRQSVTLLQYFAYQRLVICLAGMQVSLAEEKSTAAAAICMQARVKHALCKLDEAHQLYQQSLDLAEKPLAQFGIAQTLVSVVCTWPGW
jgi:glycine cleavage system pyridoxal-binding protein P